MKQILQTILISGIIAGFVSFGIVRTQEQSLAGISDSSCTVTETTVSVGDDISSTILSNAPNRAYAVVQQTPFATNTVSLSTGTAVAGEGYNLASSTAGSQITTTPRALPEFVVGLNTDFPYTGAMTAITGTGSSTVKVTECLY